MSQPMSEQDRKIWNQYMSHSGREYAFRFGRDVRRQGRQNVFSQEAFDALNRSLMLFIGSRLRRYADAHDGGYPQALNVRIRVSMDWDDDSFNDDDLPWVDAPHPAQRDVPYPTQEGDTDGTTEGG